MVRVSGESRGYIRLERKTMFVPYSVFAKITSIIATNQNDQPYHLGGLLTLGVIVKELLNIDDDALENMMEGIVNDSDNVKLSQLTRQIAKKMRSLE